MDKLQIQRIVLEWNKSFGYKMKRNCEAGCEPSKKAKEQAYHYVTKPKLSLTLTNEMDEPQIKPAPLIIEANSTKFSPDPMKIYKQINFHQIFHFWSWVFTHLHPDHLIKITISEPKGLQIGYFKSKLANKNLNWSPINFILCVKLINFTANYFQNTNERIKRTRNVYKQNK